MKVAIIYYSTFGHISTLAKKEKEGVDASGLAEACDIYLVAETLSDDVLNSMQAPTKENFPIATMETLVEYDAFLFGLPTRFGSLPAQWAEFWSKTSQLWANASLAGKPAGYFVSTSLQGGGQESTIRNVLSYLVHHGMPFIPLGYGESFPLLTDFDEVHGGSSFGAGTFAGPDGSREVSELESTLAFNQGNSFAQSASKFVKANNGAVVGEDSLVEDTESISKKEESAETEDIKVVRADKATKNQNSELKRAEQTKSGQDESSLFSCSKCTIL